MQGANRAVSILLMIIILIISIILLGVSGGIIRNFYQYGDVFRRERDLSAFNVIIAGLGILVSLFAIAAKISNRVTFCKAASTACLLLGLCGLISLIAAIAINFLTVDYVSSRFLNNMMHYKDDANARNSVDTIQRQYGCCGNNIWLEWANMPLYVASSNVNAMSTASNPTNFAGLGTGTTSSSLSQLFTNGLVGLTPATTANTGLVDNTNIGSGLNSMGTDVASIVNSGTGIQANPFQGSQTPAGKSSSTAAYFGWNAPAVTNPQTSSSSFNLINNNIPLQSQQSNLFQSSSKRKRQTQSVYGNIYGLPSSYSVSLPQSCCTSSASSTSNSFNSYCVSNANNAPNSFYTAGCANKLSKSAVSYALSIALINGFLLIFALIAASLLKKTPSGYILPSKSYRNSSIQIQQLHQGPAEHVDKEKTTKTSITNYNTDYSVFQ